MTKYQADLPFNVNEETIEALRGMGAVRLTFEVEGRNRDALAKELGNEYGWRGFDQQWWETHLIARRTRKTQR